MRPLSRPSPLPAAPVALAVALICALALAGCSRQPPPAPAPPTFTDVTETTGLPMHGLTSGAVLADLSSDGRPDLLLGRHGGPPVAFRNEGGLRFSPLSEWGRGLPVGDHHATVAEDLDLDGRLDFYFVVGAERGRGRGDNVLLLSSRAREGDVAGSLGVQDPLGRGRGALALDLDGDGRPELIVLNFRTAMRAFKLRADGPALDLAPRLFGRQPAEPDTASGIGAPRDRQRGDWIDSLLPLEPWDDGAMDFLAFGAPSVRLLYRPAERWQPDIETLPYDVYVPAPVGGARGDLDGDGHPDLYLVYGAEDAPSWFGGGRNRLLLWREGRFADAPDTVDAGGGRGTAAAAADLDNDGRLDLVVQQTSLARHWTRLLVLWNRGEARFSAPQEIGGAPGLGEGLLAADLDRDGDLDLLSLQGALGDDGEGGGGHEALGDAADGAADRGGGGVRLYRNDLGVSRWLAVRLESPGRCPYGARVEVRGDGVRLTRRLWPTQVDGSAFRQPLHFGLGSLPAGRRLHVTVAWPWGEQTELAGVEPDRVVVVQPAAR